MEFSGSNFPDSCKMRRDKRLVSIIECLSPSYLVWSNLRVLLGTLSSMFNSILVC